MRGTAPALTFKPSPCSSGERMLALLLCRAEMLLQRMRSDEGVLAKQRTALPPGSGMLCLLCTQQGTYKLA